MSTSVVRTTTEKLEAVIKEHQGGDEYLISSTFTGGRDWVLFFGTVTTLEVPPVYGREVVGEWPLADQSADPDYAGGALVAMSRNPSVNLCHVYYRGYEVPYLKVFKYPVDEDGQQIYPAAGKTFIEQSCIYRWDLVLDDRMAYDFETEAAALQAGKMLADGMAIAAGWACHGSSNRLNPHGPCIAEPAPVAVPS